MKAIKFYSDIKFMSKIKKSVESQASVKFVKSQQPVTVTKDGNIMLQVLAKPGAKSNGIISIDEDGVGVQINARPVDGEANVELTKYIISIFGLKKNEISLEKGMKSRQKLFIISKKDLTVDKVLEKLKNEIS